MARNGKIARLPRNIRAQLNTRLQDGHDGKQIVQWLNSLPQVKEVLAQRFDGRPINEQNLSDWRQGGYEEWLAHEDILAQADELDANQEELGDAARCDALTDHLAAAVAFRYGAILARPGLELDEKSHGQLRALRSIAQVVVKLRRSDQNAARLKIETERWNLARSQMAEEKAETVQRKQREALAAPIWAAVKMGERAVEFGGGKAARFAAEMLREIETCPDPAHFQSKVLAAQSPEEWRRYAQEMAKNPPVMRSPVQAALDTLYEMETGLGIKTKIRPPQSASQPPRPSPKPAKRRPARRSPVPRTVRPPAVRPADPPPSQSNPARPMPAKLVAEVYDRRTSSSVLSAQGPAKAAALAKEDAPPGGAEDTVKPNQG
jgi:hypothetical protein